MYSHKKEKETSAHPTKVPVWASMWSVWQLSVMWDVCDTSVYIYRFGRRCCMITRECPGHDLYLNKMSIYSHCSQPKLRIHVNLCFCNLNQTNDKNTVRQSDMLFCLTNSRTAESIHIQVLNRRWGTRLDQSPKRKKCQKTSKDVKNQNWFHLTGAKRREFSGMIHNNYQ